jgi:hypothetical protein
VDVFQVGGQNYQTRKGGKSIRRRVFDTVTVLQYSKDDNNSHEDAGFLKHDFLFPRCWQIGCYAYLDCVRYKVPKYTVGIRTQYSKTRTVLELSTR